MSAHTSREHDPAGADFDLLGPRRPAPLPLRSVVVEILRDAGGWIAPGEIRRQLADRRGERGTSSGNLAAIFHSLGPAIERRGSTTHRRVRWVGHAPAPALERHPRDQLLIDLLKEAGGWISPAGVRVLGELRGLPITPVQFRRSCLELGALVETKGASRARRVRLRPAGTTAGRALAALDEAGRLGLTSEEVAHRAGVRWNHACRALRQLHADGRAAKLGDRGGVWFAAWHAPKGAA